MGGHRRAHYVPVHRCARRVMRRGLVEDPAAEVSPDSQKRTLLATLFRAVRSQCYVCLCFVCDGEAVSLFRRGRAHRVEMELSKTYVACSTTPRQRVG